jgi:hypothetical protein
MSHFTDIVGRIQEVDSYLRFLVKLKTPVSSKATGLVGTRLGYISVIQLSGCDWRVLPGFIADNTIASNKPVLSLVKALLSDHDRTHLSGSRRGYASYHPG